MRGSSAESLTRLEAALSGLPAGGSLGSDLLAAAGALRDQVAVRRAATDPSAPAEAKSALLRGVFANHVGEAALGLLADAGSQRWASSLDLVEAVESLGVAAVVRGADAAGEGDRLEDELFVVGRTITDSPDLRDALGDPSRSTADKQALLESVLGGKASAATVLLAREAVAARQPVTAVLARYGREAAAVRGRLVATVRTAAPLNAEQQGRLASSLANNGQTVHLNVIVDPSVVGGLRVELGDHIIDGTIASRVDDARRKIAG